MKKEVISIISEITSIDENEIASESKLNDDPEFNYIKAIETTVAIKTQLLISIRDDDVPQIITVGQAIKLVDNLLKEKNIS